MTDSMEIIYITSPTNSDRFYKFTESKSIKTTYNLQGHVGNLGFGEGIFNQKKHLSKAWGSAKDTLYRWGFGPTPPLT